MYNWFMYDKEPKWAKYITEDSIDDYGLLDLVNIIGLEATKKLMIHYAGNSIRIPKSANTKYKHQYVLDNYDGTKISRMRTAIECQITENYIFKIMKMYKDKSQCKNYTL